MKRLLWTAFLALMAFVACACGRMRAESGQASEPPEATSRSQETVSGAAATPVPAAEAYVQAENMLVNMTLEQKIGQMFLVDLYQLDQKRTLDGGAYEMTAAMGETIRRYNIGGVFLTDVNIKDKGQCRRLADGLQAEAVTAGALYIAVEEDGGGSNSISARIGGLGDTGYIAPIEMGTGMPEKQIYQAGENIGGALTNLGINLNLAPVADIGNEKNPQYARRCLGMETEQVSAKLDDYVSGMREGGLAVTLKHFPGIGNVPGEYSETVLENTDSLMSLRNNNFPAYRSGIEAGADCIMVSNVSFSEITVNKTPAFISRDIVTTLLREELNFEGIIMTPPFDDNVIRDQYTYEFATVEAVRAGCDMIVLPGKLEECYRALLEAVKAGKIEEKTIDASVCRILQNKIQRGILMFDHN